MSLEWKHIIGTSLSELHTDKFRFCRVYIFIQRKLYIYIYALYVRLTVYFHLQNGQDGCPLRSGCMRLNYSPRTASNEKEIVRQEVDTATTESDNPTKRGQGYNLTHI